MGHVKFNDYKGFTIVEVLLTLVIISVVSLILLKTMQANQENQWKQVWKKEYSVFEQMAKMIIVDYSANLDTICPDQNYNCFGNIMAQYLSYIKYCDNNSVVNKGCFHDYNKIKTLHGTNLTTLTGDNSPLNGNNNNGFILNDGSLVSFYYRVSTPDSDMDYYKGATQGGDSVAAIAVDVNGWKGPNQLGKDIFCIIMHTNKLTPGGSGGYPCDKNSTNDYNGFGCGVKAIMNMDY